MAAHHLNQRIPYTLYHRRFWSTSGGTGLDIYPPPAPREVAPRERRDMIAEESFVAIVNEANREEDAATESFEHSMHMLFNQFQQKYSSSQMTNQWMRAVKSMTETVFSFVPKEGIEHFQNFVDYITRHCHQVLPSYMAQNGSAESREEHEIMAAAAAAAASPTEAAAETTTAEEYYEVVPPAAGSCAGPFTHQASLLSSSPPTLTALQPRVREILPAEGEEDVFEDTTGTTSRLGPQRPQKRQRSDGTPSRTSQH